MKAGQLVYALNKLDNLTQKSHLIKQIYAKGITAKNERVRDLFSTMLGMCRQKTIDGVGQIVSNKGNLTQTQRSLAIDSIGGAQIMHETIYLDSKKIATLKSYTRAMDVNTGKITDIY